MNTPRGNTGTINVTTPSEREITMTRRLRCSASHLVFDALTKPELVRRWLLGPEGWTMPVCEIDLRVGGAWRYVWRNADGREFGMGGVYREIAAPDRIVHTERFEDGESLVTTLFNEQAGRTTLTMTMLFATQEARDEALKSGMADGVAVSYDRLDEVLASIAAKG
jgi:uncharacterized protein YndB with AHSA1/START domain